MPDRLSALDASFLYLEQSTTPMHVGGVAVLQAPQGRMDYEQLLELVEARLPLVPRYRQKVLPVPGRLARPVWSDDPDFDITYHVRRSALPRPGSEAQLNDLVARLLSRPLDRSRPLWELYLIEGLEQDRAALVHKSHQAMVDGIGSRDISEVLFSPTPGEAEPRNDLWMPRVEPGPTALLASAAGEMLQRPGAVVENARSAGMGVTATARRLGNTAGAVARAGWSALRPAPMSPLNVRISGQRRFAKACAELSDFQTVRARHGGTVNDAVLAVVAGAMREWLLSRGEAVGSSTMIRAMTPMSVARSGTAQGWLHARAHGKEGSQAETAEGTPPVVATDSTASQVSGYLVDLPVGEPNPVVRLQHIGHDMREHAEAVQSVTAADLVRLSGFAPPTIHALGARVASSFSRRLFNVLVTNVPGPQQPHYVGNVGMERMYPVVPLAKGQALAIGVTSYDGMLHFGLNADRNAMPDVDVLASMLGDALEELMETVPK